MKQQQIYPRAKQERITKCTQQEKSTAIFPRFNLGIYAEEGLWLECLCADLYLHLYVFFSLFSFVFHLDCL